MRLYRMVHKDEQTGWRLGELIGGFAAGGQLVLEDGTTADEVGPALPGGDALYQGGTTLYVPGDGE